MWRDAKLLIDLKVSPFTQEIGVAIRTNWALSKKSNKVNSKDLIDPLLTTNKEL